MPMSVLIVLIAFGIIAFISINLKILAKFGWNKLAKVYPAGIIFDGMKLKYRSCSFNSMRYNGIVTLGADHNGLFIEIGLPVFRIGHQPLFIPWAEISIEDKDVKILSKTISLTEITTAQVPKMVVTLTRKDATALIAEKEK